MDAKRAEIKELNERVAQQAAALREADAGACVWSQLHRPRSGFVRFAFVSGCRFQGRSVPAVGWSSEPPLSSLPLKFVRCVSVAPLRRHNIIHFTHHFAQHSSYSSHLVLSPPPLPPPPPAPTCCRLLGTHTAELREWSSSMTAEEMRSRIAELSKRTREAEEKLGPLRSGAVLVTPEERGAVEKVKLTQHRTAQHSTAQHVRQEARGAAALLVRCP